MRTALRTLRGAALAYIPLTHGPWLRDAPGVLSLYSSWIGIAIVVYRSVLCVFWLLRAAVVPVAPATLELRAFGSRVLAFGVAWTAYAPLLAIVGAVSPATQEDAVVTLLSAYAASAAMLALIALGGADLTGAELASDGDERFLVLTPRGQPHCGAPPSMRDDPSKTSDGEAVCDGVRGGSGGGGSGLASTAGSPSEVVVAITVPAVGARPALERGNTARFNLKLAALDARSNRHAADGASPRRRPRSAAQSARRIRATGGTARPGRSRRRESDRSSSRSSGSRSDNSGSSARSRSTSRSRARGGEGCATERRARRVDDDRGGTLRAGGGPAGSSRGIDGAPRPVDAASARAAARNISGGSGGGGGGGGWTATGDQSSAEAAAGSHGATGTARGQIPGRGIVLTRGMDISARRVLNSGRRSERKSVGV